jgi:hypothetical protein
MRLIDLAEMPQVQHQHAAFPPLAARQGSVSSGFRALQRQSRPSATARRAPASHAPSAASP